jgi:hypothetical protein
MTLSTKCGSGASTDEDASKALSVAIEQAKTQGEIDNISFALVYFTAGHSKADIEAALNDQLKNIPNSGGSGAGVLAQNFASEDSYAISVMLFGGDEIQFESVLFENLKGQDYKIGIEAGKWIKTQSNIKSLIVFADGLTCNYGSLLEGIEENLRSKDKFPIFGGLTADDFSFKDNYQIYNGKLYSDSFVCLSMKGDFKIAWGVNHGCTPISEKRKITKADKNIIYEIDKMPVLDVLREYLAEEEIDNWQWASLNTCLGFKAPRDFRKSYDDYIIRFMPHKNEEDGSVQISSEVKAGTDVWLTRRDQDKIESGIIEISNTISKQLNGNKAKVVFHFDCGGRGRQIMDEDRKMKTVRFIQNEIGNDIPWSGFYTFGEMAPVNGKNSFHNYTAVLLVIY